MGNFFSELYKGLRAVGVGFKDARRAVREERNAQRTEQAFAEQFGVSFDELVRRAVEPRIERIVVDILQRHLPSLLPRALPDVLWQLAQDGPALGQPAQAGGEGTADPGTLVACLSRSNGAYWGVAPAGEAPDRSTAAFHAFLSYDTEEGEYTINMLEGLAQVVGYDQKHVAGTSVGSTDENHKNWWCWLEWTQSTNSWSLESANSQPSMSGDLNVPLWKFTWAADGAGQLIQYVEGAILLTWTVNALDVDSAS